MQATLEDAILVLKKIVLEHLVDEAGDIGRPSSLALHDALAFLHAAGEVENHDYKDSLGRTVNRQLRLKSSVGRKHEFG